MSNKRFEEEYEDWPEPPSFDANSPNQYPKRIEPTYLMKQFRGERLSDMPAPFTTHSGKMTEAERTNQISIMSKNMEKSMKHLSNKNPFRIDTQSDPFAPESPSFFNKNKTKTNNDNMNDNDTMNESEKLLKSLHSMPPPCQVMKPKTKWNDLSSFEKKEYYLDKKREFKEYLDETFSLRLELQNESACQSEMDAYQRCLNIKNQWWGGYKFSTGRGALAQIFFCNEQFKEYNHCIQAVDTAESEMKLKQEDEKTIHQMFPR